MRGVSKMARLSPRLLAALLGGLVLLHAGPAYAASGFENVSWADLTAGDDWSSRVLDSLFPMDGTADTATGTLLQWFTSFVGLMAAFWILYSILVQIHKTAETGKVFSASFSGWVPVRAVASVILMLPVLNGFSLGENLIVHFAKTAIGMAIIEEKVVMDAVGPQALPLATPIIPGSRQVVLGVMESEICRALINKASNNPDLVPEPAIIDDGNGTVSISYSMAGGNGGAMPTCGLVSISTPVRTATTTEYQSIDFSGVSSQQIASLKTLTTNIRSGLQNTITSLWETRDVATLGGLDTVFVAQTNYLNGQLTGIASSVVAAVRSAAGSTASDNSATAELRSLGWTGLGAYYLEISRLNAEVISVSSITPAVVAPSWAGTGPYLGQDLQPFLQSVSSYLGKMDAALQTADEPAPNSTSPRLYANARVSSDSTAIWTKVLNYLNFGPGALERIMDHLVMGSSGTDWVDPLGAMIGLGHLLIHLALTAIALSVAAGSFSLNIGTGIASLVTGQVGGAAAAAVATFLSGTITRLLPEIFTACLFLLSAGVTLAYVLPMMPYLYWIAGVTGWFLLVIEAVAYAPLWFLAHMTFAGDGIHGKGVRGYEVLFTILFRPSMMVIGMVFSYTVFSAISWLLMKSFLVASTFTLDHGYLTDNWVGLIAMIIMYSAMEMTTATLSFRLITTLPHHMASMVGFGAASRVDAEDFEKSSTRPVEQGAETGRQIGTQYLEGLKDEAKKSGGGGGSGGTVPAMDTTTAAQVRPITQTDV
ncbi:DotA/TraY family protein [Acetobacter sp.]|jgi:conjugal transfer/type IV secretion protein DotA/TraY|uniref:DotA/TraY family protein n=1 Tax=Acetobacter sp. TaxID=440 RepID=UPI0025BD6F2C|nr:DotA/TraY family protein [Acetobacter sp.]MCI1301346.1 DotA/TraY family protein [Acetobacter sp.]